MCSLKTNQVPKEDRKKVSQKLFHSYYNAWIDINPIFDQYLGTIPPTGIPRYKIEHLTRPFSYYLLIMKTNFLWSLRIDDGAYINVQNLHYLMNSLKRLDNPLFYPILQGCCFPAYPNYLEDRLPSVQTNYQRYVIQGGSGHLTSRFFIVSYLAIAEEVLRLQDCDDDWQIGDWAIKLGLSPMDFGSPYFFSQTKDFWELPIILSSNRQFEKCKGDLIPTRDTCGVNKIVPLKIKVVFHEQSVYFEDMVKLMKMNYSDVALYHDYSLRISFCNWTQYEANMSNI